MTLVHAYLIVGVIVAIICIADLALATAKKMHSHPTFILFGVHYAKAVLYMAVVFAGWFVVSAAFWPVFVASFFHRWLSK